MICVDSSRRRAPSIIAVWPRPLRMEGDCPAGGGRLCCWPTLCATKAGAVLFRGGGGSGGGGPRVLFAESPLSCGSSALSFERANTDGDLLLWMRRMRRTRIISTHGYGTHGLPVVLFLGGHSSANFEHVPSCVMMQPDCI